MCIRLKGEIRKREEIKTRSPNGLLNLPKQTKDFIAMATVCFQKDVLTESVSLRDPYKKKALVQLSEGRTIIPGFDS